MELPPIVSKRIHFLKTYREMTRDGLYDCVFLDETWIFQNGTVQRSWQNEDKRTVKSIKTDGKRRV